MKVASALLLLFSQIGGVASAQPVLVANDRPAIQFPPHNYSEPIALYIIADFRDALSVLSFSVRNTRKDDGCEGWLLVSATRLRLNTQDRSCSFDLPRTALTNLKLDDSSATIAFGATSVRLQPALTVFSPSTESQGRIGASIGPLSEPERRELRMTTANGAKVYRVDFNSPAYRGGLKLFDVIVEVNGQPVSEPREVLDAISKAAGGERIAMRVVGFRDRRMRTVNILVEEYRTNGYWPASDLKSELKNEMPLFLGWIERALSSAQSFDETVLDFLSRLRSDSAVAAWAGNLALQVGESHARQGRYAAAETWLSKSLSLAPVAAAYWFRGYARLRNGDRNGAQADLTKYLEYPVRYGPYSRELGLLLLEPDRAKVRDDELRAGEAAEREGSALGAFRHYQKAFALTLPTFQDELEQDKVLTSALIRTWRAAQPKPELPEEARRFAVQAQALAEAKRYQEAESAYATVAHLCPWYPQAYFNRALILAAMEQYPDAIAAMNRYIEIVSDAPDVRAVRDQIYKWEVLVKKP